MIYKYSRCELLRQITKAAKAAKKMGIESRISVFKKSKKIAEYNTTTNKISDIVISASCICEDTRPVYRWELEEI